MASTSSSFPIFQRDYSWGTKQCAQLWEDILRVGRDPQAKAHFLGSVVYIGAEDIAADVPRWLVIDGQQRLTTMTLLMAALRDQLRTLGDSDDHPTSAAAVEDRFLQNRHAKADRRSKLALRRIDQDTLNALVAGKDLPSQAATRVRENYAYFLERFAEAELETVWRGIGKLVVVHVSLTRGQDDPQLIFESLNSTGLDLTQADLIRNFVLMRLDEGSGTRPPSRRGSGTTSRPSRARPHQRTPCERGDAPALARAETRAMRARARRTPSSGPLP